MLYSCNRDFRQVMVDFFQPDDVNPSVSAAGIWPVQ